MTPSRAAHDVGAAYRGARVPRGRTDWTEAAWAAIDLETTGLDPARDEIISFGVVPIDGARIVAGGSLYRVVRPRRPPRPDSITIHGIRAADLEDAPPLPDVLDELLSAITGRRLVAHAAFVERGFLGPALRARRLRLRGEIVDTQLLARIWMHEAAHGTIPPLMSLGDLVARLGLPAHRPHHALGDALTTAQAFLALATHLDGGRGLSVRTLLGEQTRARRRGL